MPRRVPTSTELALWDKVTAGVKRRARGSRLLEEKTITRSDEPPAPDRGGAHPAREHGPPSRQKSKINRPELQPVAMDRRILQRLRSRRLSIDGRLDLHGLTQAEAHRRLCEFVDRNHRAGKRVLLVITGRGDRDDGILKRMVPGWLSSAPAARYVLAVSNAHAMHGGVGALYVQLRRPHGGWQAWRR